MTRLVAIGTLSDQFFLRVDSQSVPPLNVMELKTFHPPARLATPSISF
jgi:hypothetical protein